jgi:pimeloyl-ACP methyl ester carboxylesterase
VSHYRRSRRRTHRPIPAEQATSSRSGRSSSSGFLGPLLVGSAAALGAAALYNLSRAKSAENQHPPIGKFLTVDGVRLHYMERGRGEPLVLIHGNGTMIEDFVVSDLVSRLAEHYRVIVIDRPGYGYSARPRGLWTPRAHATLFRNALAQLGVDRALVLGHSWGTLVALALAIQDPSLVRGLVLVSGYYFPTARADVVLFSPPAIPVIGDIMRYTISPPVAHLMLPGLLQAMFAPASVTRRFDREFPKELMLRPSQLRASAEDAALMTPSVMELQSHYAELRMPVIIVAGGDDQIVDVGRHSARLHHELPGSELTIVPGQGHMVHHLAPEQVVGAVRRASQAAEASIAGI